MRILFDQGAPVPLRKSLANREVVTAFEMGWQTLQNGDLLAAAEQAGFEVLVTTDQNLGHQQNLRDRKLGIVVLSISVLLVMIVELLNTGIETAIDRIGPEWHDLSKRAKDMGSAAVLLSLLLCIGVWCAAMFQRFSHG